MSTSGPPPKKLKQAKLSFAPVSKESSSKDTPDDPFPDDFGILKSVPQRGSSESSDDCNKQIESATAVIIEGSNCTGFTNKYDIGNYSKAHGRKLLDDETKLALITDCWVPDSSFNFPQCANSRRRFQHSWLKRYNWLAYSDAEKGVFCKPCLIFATESAGAHGNQILKTLVSTPFNKYKDAIEVFNKHNSAKYHADAVNSCEMFLKFVTNKVPSIDNQLDNTRQQQIITNRQRIRPMIETVLFLGHRDSGNIANTSTENDGNFRSALRFRINAGDNYLKRHIETAGGSAMYTSWNTQNEIINTVGDIISEKIVDEVKDAKYFSVLVDETTDCSTKEQMSLSVRYVHDGKVCEKFLTFVTVNDLTGHGLAKSILDILHEKTLDPMNMRGQGYDGASAMSGQFNGVQACIREKNPLAVYTHCASHVLNLVVSHESNLPTILNTISTIQEICSLFGSSAKKQSLLSDYITKTAPESSHKRLKKLCTARWVERHEAVNVFYELYVPIEEALEYVSHNDMVTDHRRKERPHCLLLSDLQYLSWPQPY